MHRGEGQAVSPWGATPSNPSPHPACCLALLNSIINPSFAVYLFTCRILTFCYFFGVRLTSAKRRALASQSATRCACGCVAMPRTPAMRRAAAAAAAPPRRAAMTRRCRNVVFWPGRTAFFLLLSFFFLLSSFFFILLLLVLAVMAAGRMPGRSAVDGQCPGSLVVGLCK